MKYTSSRKFGVAIVLSATLISGLNAQAIHLDKFFYRDFLDLGQNKGAFSVGAENVVIHSSKTPGVSVSFEAPIIDQSARSNNGNTTSLGRNFVITATHVAGSSGDSNDSLVNSQTPEMRRWGQTTYSISPNSKSQNYGYDITFTRFNKYIVEGETEIFDAGLESDQNINAGNPNTQHEQKNLERLKEYLKNNATDSNGNLIVFQAGSGRLNITNTPVGGLGFREAGIAAITGTRGGSFSRPVDLSRITYENSTANANVGARGIQLIDYTDLTWVNGISPGDSGSGFYIYDKNKQKWLLLGVTSKADLVGQGSSGIAVATKADFEKFKESNEQKIDLKGSNWTFDNSNFNGSNGNSWVGKQNNKDLVFSSGGSIEVQNNIRLLDSGQVGGFVFKADKNASASNLTTYKITSNGTSGKIYGFDGAGLDIDENVKVEWGLGFISGKATVNDALHKVGKGTLEIKTGANAEQGYLRVGDGKVIFNTEHQVFKGVYLTSGRATLELTKDKAQAFGAVKVDSQLDSKLPHHFKLEQNNKDSLGIYFGNGGGNLDLKGNSLTLNTISSNDSRANIINTDTDGNNPSYITIEGYGYDKDKKKTQEKADTIIHASFGQSTDSKNDNSKTNGNLNLIYKGDDKTSIDSTDKAALVFDGNVNAKGLEVDNGKVVLQGHPTTHAYIRDQEVTVTQYGQVIKKSLLQLIKDAEGPNLPKWMDLSRPSTLEQPDWDHRVFKIGTIDLQNSRLDVGREATLEGKIKADSSSAINFGGDIEHYIDKKDGENTTGNGFEYQQEAEKAKLEAETQKIANQTIHFKGEIDADGTKINSSIYDFNAKLDLKNKASLNADFLTLDRETHKTGAILAMNNSTAEVKNLIFKGLKDTANDIVSITGTSSLKVTESLGFESSTFDLDKLSSIGNGNFTKPTNYDLFVKDKSKITGTNTAITGNVGVMNESTLSLKSITLKDTQGNTKDIQATSIKNSIIVEGKESKLQVQDKITSQNQDNTLIVVNGFRETTGGGTRDIVQGARQEVVHSATLSTTGGIELSGTKAYGVDTKCSGDSKSGVGCFDDESMQGKISNIVLTTGGKIESNLKATNLQLNVNVDKDSSFLGKDKTLTADKSSVALNFELGGEKEQEFNITANQKSHITLTAHAKEALAKDTAAFEKALESSQYKGKITADNGSQIDSNLSNITASVDLKNGASLNVANGGILTLKDSLNSINLSGTNTALNVGTIVAEKLQNLTLNVTDNAKFNVTNFVFKGGSVSNDKFYGQNVWLQDQASVTLKGSEGIQHNLYVSGDSTFKTESGKALKIDKEGETKIQTEIGSKLEINKLEADKKSNVYVALDLEKLEVNPATKQAVVSQQKNFNIDAKGGSNVYVNVWDMNRTGFDGGNTSLKTDADSRIHFGILKHDMANKNYIESPIKANLSISQSLTLESVGKPTASGGNKVAQNSVNAGAMSRDITSESAKTPTNQTHSESDPLKLQAQAGTNDDRFHALKLEGNTMNQGQVQNTGKNLTLGDGTRIEVKLDSSIKAESSNGGSGKPGDFQLNKYYTLISAGSITDNRTDKRIYFTFAEGNQPLYWVTIVENGEVKVKFTKEDPSSYNELKNYINDDKLLEILIQHNPKNDYVQMAGTANQHKELDGYLGVLNKDMEHIAKNTEMNISEKVLLANDQSINTRIAQARYAQSRFALSPIKLASNDEKDVALALGAIKSMREKNSAWLSMGAGAFMQGGDNKANLSFYSTNVGYDRLFNIGDDELIFGVMAGFGGSNYSASSLSDNAMVMNLGLYGLYQTGKHEIQSNLSVSSISGDRSVQGILGGEKAKADSLGLLSHSYYKYRFLLKETDSFESMLKPVGLFSIGYNGIGEYRGTNYAQQAFNAFNVGLGAGVEYALVGKKTSYTFSLLAKQNVYSSANQVFVTLSNAQNFIGYEINPTALTFQLGFVGTKQFDKGFALQYGLTGMSDIQGGFGGKGDIRLEYKF
ncbi:S6 family peptidase [Helicobacter cinaedi]|uniref:Anti-codon nuclease masking agent n=1 Tax=Helicobacter cinaedi TaxID=213 RepID=A0A377JVY0_9HELI|nr:S6 family peptidase [Helicobacter cinaedi]STP13461.1 anti-codon nuclease masking agent [Helicobacter cinaedi]